MVDLSNINRPAQNTFDWTSLLGLLQQREEMELRRQEAQVSLAQQQFNLEFSKQTRELRIEEMVLQNAQRTEAIKQSQAETDLASAATAWFNGYNKAVGGEAADTASVAGFVGNLEPTAQAAATASFPRSQRKVGAQQAGGFFRQVIGGTIDMILGTKDGRQSEMARALLGFGDHAETIQPFSSEYQEKAFQVLSRELSGIRSSLQAIPGGKYLMRSAVGSADAMLDMFDGAIGELQKRFVNLADPAYSHPELEGEQQAAMIQAEERFRELDDQRRKVAAGKTVLDTGAGVVTQDDMDGVRAIIGARVNEVYQSQHPSVAVFNLAEDLEKANFIPSKEIAPVFEAAQQSTDPLAQLRASMVWEEIQRRFPLHKENPLAEELNRLGLLDSLTVMGNVRKGLGFLGAQGPLTLQEEGLAGPPTESQQQLMLHAAVIADHTEKAMENIRAIAETERTVRRAIPKDGETLPENDFEVLRMVADDYLGSDGFFWFQDSGLLGELGIDKEAALRSDNGGLFREFWTHFATAKANSNEARAKYATIMTAQNYPQKGSLTSDDEVTRSHPLKVARGVFGREDMDPDFALKFARMQLQRDLDSLKDRDGNPLRVRLEDVQAIPSVDVNGHPMWYIHRIGQQNALMTFRADFSTEAMLEAVADDNVGFTFTDTGLLPRIRDINEGIHRYLGASSPRRVQARERARKKEEERIESDRRFRQAQESFRYVPAELQPVDN